MNHPLTLLHRLLFINPTIGCKPSFSTQNCTTFHSTSAIRSCNRVISTALPADTEIEHIKQFFGNIPFTWAVEQHDTHLAHILEQHNLSCKSSFPAMILNLGHQYTLDNAMPNIVVRAIDMHDNDELTPCITIIARAFHGISSCPSDIFELIKVINFFVRTITPGNLTFYLGYYQDIPVATGMVLHHNETASLHWIGTLPEYRNKGLGYAITHTILCNAQNKGCTQAILLASPLGKPLYERMGFKEYAAYNMYGNY